MKKVLSILLSVIMVTAMTCTVMAGESGFQINTEPDASEISSESSADLNQIFGSFLNNLSASPEGTIEETPDLSQIFGASAGDASASGEEAQAGSFDLSQILGALSSGAAGSGEEAQSGSLDLSQILGALSAAAGSGEEGQNGSFDLSQIFGASTGDASANGEEAQSGSLDLSQILGALFSSGSEDASESIKEGFSSLFGSLSDAAGDLGQGLSSLFDSLSDAAGQMEIPTGDSPQLTGGWRVNNEYVGAIDAKIADYFDEAVSTQEDMEYLAIALLGTQVVAGTNYAFLANGTPKGSESEGAWYVVTVYVNLQGKPEILSIEEIALDDIQTGDITDMFLTGAWSIADPAEEDFFLPEDALNAYNAAMQKTIGVDYHPIVLLGRQLVSGTNYKILAYGTLVTKEPVTSLYVIDLYENLEGEVEVTDIEVFDLTAYINY